MKAELRKRQRDDIIQSILSYHVISISHFQSLALTKFGSTLPNLTKIFGVLRTDFLYLLGGKESWAKVTV